MEKIIQYIYDTNWRINMPTLKGRKGGRSIIMVRFMKLRSQYIIFFKMSVYLSSTMSVHSRFKVVLLCNIPLDHKQNKGTNGGILYLKWSPYHKLTPSYSMPAFVIYDTWSNSQIVLSFLWLCSSLELVNMKPLC